LSVSPASFGALVANSQQNKPDLPGRIGRLDEMMISLRCASSCERHARDQPWHGCRQIDASIVGGNPRHIRQITAAGDSHALIQARAEML
jgi:hypothetical protein